MIKEVSKDKLHELYVIEGLSMKAVAQRMGIAVGTVHKYIKKYNIPARGHGDHLKGKKRPPEVCEAISRGNVGKKISPEARHKMSEAKKLKGSGHKKVRVDGYIAIYYPTHPKSSKSGYVMEHILVMESMIGRHLQDGEVVHHKNKIRNDNRKENLQLMTIQEHARLHMIERNAMKKGVMTY